MSQSKEEELNELRSVVAKLQGQVRSLLSPEAKKAEEEDAARKQAARARLAEAEEALALYTTQRDEARAELGLTEDFEPEPITEPRRRVGAKESDGDKRARIRKLVNASKGLFIAQIVDATGYTPSAVHTHVKVLEKAGHVWTEEKVYNPETGRGTGTKVYPKTMMRPRRKR